MIKESVAKKIFQMLWLIMMPWPNLYIICRTCLHMQQKSISLSFNTIQLDGCPNDVMIGDQRHNVQNLMTSSAADRQISNNRLKMSNDVENVTPNNNVNVTPINNSHGRL